MPVLPLGFPALSREPAGLEGPVPLEEARAEAASCAVGLGAARTRNQFPDAQFRRGLAGLVVG